MTMVLQLGDFGCQTILLKTENSVLACQAKRDL